MRRIAKRILTRRGTVCFFCGREGSAPCAGHEAGGTIQATFVRRWAPYWLVWLTQAAS